MNSKNLLHSTKSTVLAGVALLTMALLPTACSEEKQATYTISGVVVGGTSSDSIYLEIMERGELKLVQKTALTDSTFSFRGTQDSLAVYYISCVTEKDAFSTPIFVENADIRVRLEDVNEVITGTPANDAYQEIRGQINDVRRRMFALSADTTLTEALREERFIELEDEYDRTYKEGLKKNITNPVGIFLFKQKHFENTLAENQALYKQIPEQYLNDIELQGLKKMLENQETTNISQPFTDLELQDMQGKTVKLSDFVGKGKPVLIDFWASWCGPCRQAMPELVELYRKHKGKFELIGISLDDDQDAWDRATNKLGITWPQMSDLKGWESVAAITYGINSIPHTILIDKEGKIVARELHGESLETQLVALF